MKQVVLFALISVLAVAGLQAQEAQKDNVNASTPQIWAAYQPYVSEPVGDMSAGQQGARDVKMLGMNAPTRFLSVDRFADKYPSMTPYQYAANNPVLFVDVNGDSIIISDEMKENEALANYLSAEEGRKQIAQFAYEGQTITVAGQEFKFEEAGKYSTQNVNFVGVDNSIGAHTVPINSIGGDYFVSEQGMQTYNVYIGPGSTGNQADDVFHEVQHAEIFATYDITGKIDPAHINYVHHTAMTGAWWGPHERYINQVNALNPTLNLKAKEVGYYLQNQADRDRYILAKKRGLIK